ncbi:MAG: hypothetical protein MJ252_07875 [archaeon]|nr:hypothetical protein [archaeon]
MEIKNPNPYPESFDINLLKNPFQCRKCKQLPLMAYTFQLPGEIKCKCLCGYDWITSVYNLVGYTHLENVILTRFKSENKNPTENQNYEELTKRCEDIYQEIITKWKKILDENPKFLIEKFNINFNLRCKKHKALANQYFCKTCILPLCEKCRRAHLEHEIEEPSLNDNNKITQLLIDSIQPFKAMIQEPKNNYTLMKGLIENNVTKLKISKVTKTDGDKNTDIIKYDDMKLHLYNKSINQLLTNELIFLFAQINIAVLKLSLPNPNFVILHNAANTTEFNFTQFKTINPGINGGEIFRTSEQLLSFYNSHYLVGNYDENKTTISKRKRIIDLPFNLKQIKVLEKIPFSTETQKVNYVIALHDGKIAVASSSGSIKIFNNNNQMEMEIKGHKEGVNWLLSLSQSDLLSCSDDTTIRRWKIERNALSKIFSSTPYKCEAIYEGHTQKIMKIDFLKDPENSNSSSPSGEVLSVSKDGTLRKWNCKEKKSTPIEIIKRPGVSTFIQLSNRNIILCSDDGIVGLWEADKDKFKKNEKLQLKNVQCFSTGSISEFGKNFVLVGQQKSIVVINYKTFEIYEEIEHPALGSVGCFMKLNPASCIVCGYNKFWILQFEEMIFEIKEIQTMDTNAVLNLFTSLISLGGNDVCSTSIDNNIIKWKFE